MAPSDPYTAKANEDTSTKQKIDEVFDIIGQVKTGMLTTRDKEGNLHSRAMAPASKDGLLFRFFANNHSGKFDEIDADSHVNISFYAPSTDWVSIAGTARTTDDLKEKETFWNPMTKAWFGDLGDGKHDGSFRDPRVTLIVVEPSSINVWKTKKSSIGQLADIAKGAITGETAAPGALRTITSDELKQERERAGVSTKAT